MVNLRLNLSRLVTILEIIALTLSMISIFTQAMVYQAGSENAAWFIPLVDVDHELSLPSIYSTLLFFCISGVLILISKLKLKDRDVYRWHWFFLIIIFAFLGFDEGASIHEKISEPTKNLMGGEGLPGFTQYAWVIPSLALVLIVAAAYLKFLLSLPPRTRSWLIAAGIIYFSGALGLETLGAIYAGENGIKNLPYNIFVTIEEFLEMSGLVMAFYTFLDYAKATFSRVIVRVTND